MYLVASGKNYCSTDSAGTPSVMVVAASAGTLSGMMVADSAGTLSVMVVTDHAALPSRHLATLGRRDVIPYQNTTPFAHSHHDITLTATNIFIRWHQSRRTTHPHHLHQGGTDF